MFILFYFILFYFILFYFILFYFILFYFILFYFILLECTKCIHQEAGPIGPRVQYPLAEQCQIPLYLTNFAWQGLNVHFIAVDRSLIPLIKFDCRLY